MPAVLVVEDETPLRRIVLLSLARRGYTVAEADSVTTAIEALEAFARPFDVIVLDINLPDQTGWDVLRYLRERAIAPPRVIVMTAVRPAQCRLEVFHPVALLLKPFPIEALVRLIERTLKRPAATGAQR